MNENWLESIQLKNGTTLVSILGYLGDEDFYAMYDIILELLHPDSPTYGVDSMGPFEMMDMSGLDTFPHVTEILEKLPVTSWACPESVKAKIAEGKYGRKSGEGWHKYN